MNVEAAARPALTVIENPLHGFDGGLGDHGRRSRDPIPLGSHDLEHHVHTDARARRALHGGDGVTHDLRGNATRCPSPDHDDRFASCGVYTWNARRKWKLGNRRGK